MRHGVATPGDHHFLASLYFVQQLAQMRLRLGKIDGNHRFLFMVMKLVM
jgi:hypothetical protein